MIEVSGKMGLRADGTVWNIPTTSKASLIIKKDTGDRRFVQISSNDYFGTNQNTDPDSKHTLLVTKDGKLYAFGNNQNGELGVGSGNVALIICNITPSIDMTFFINRIACCFTYCNFYRLSIIRKSDLYRF